MYSGAWDFHKTKHPKLQAPLERAVLCIKVCSACPNRFLIGASLETIIETYGEAGETLQERDERYMTYRYYDAAGLCLQFTIFKAAGKAINIQIRRQGV